MTLGLSGRQRRWLDALLVLSTLAVLYVLLGFLATFLAAFGDIILVFLIAWLLALVLGPIARFLANHVPGLPGGVAVILVYGAVIGSLLLALFLLANTLVSSIADFIASVPQIQAELPALVAVWQTRLDGLGLGIDLVPLGRSVLDSLNGYLLQLAGPLQQIAVASLGVVGNLVFIVVLSIYMAADSGRMSRFIQRIVPPGYEGEARFLQTSVASSFGGFLRGQATMGVVYALVAAFASVALGLEFAPVTIAAAGVLMAIPFFGPFVAWSPPVLVAIVFAPDAVVPALGVMAVGWVLVMNVLQPRLMERAVGIHPVAVLASVLIGFKVAGVPGAIFGIPIAAVASAFFFHWFTHYHDKGTVAERAAQLIADREGRPVRVPREPVAGRDLDPELSSASDSEPAAQPERAAQHEGNG